MTTETDLPQRHPAGLRAVRGVAAASITRLPLRRATSASEIAAGTIDRPRRARPARRHAGHPRAGGDDRQAALGGAYEPIRDYNYRGPTHVSIGQEAPRSAPPRAAARRQHHQHAPRPRREPRQGLRRHPPDDRRAAPGARPGAQRRRDPRGPARGGARGARLPHHRRAVRQGRGLLPRPRRRHAHRRLLGRPPRAPTPSSAAACRSPPARRWPTATSAATGVVCCFAGDGAYANGVVLESLNLAAQDQFTNHLAGDRPYRPADHLPHPQQPLRHDPSHRRRGHGRATTWPAARPGSPPNNMHAEVVNGMDVLAVRDAVTRAAELCRDGRGPGPHRGLHLPLLRPLAVRSAQRVPHPGRGGGLEGGRPDREPQGPAGRRGRRDEPRRSPRSRRASSDRNARAARAPSAATDPDPADVLTFLYTDDRDRRRAGRSRGGRDLRGRCRSPSASNGEIIYKDALREALVEEMARDNRVIFYGEDVADYGGAFKVTKGLLEAFGRDRVFNTPISEACICGTAVGAAMVGAAAGGRADVHRLRADVVRPDQQPGREVALHERRARPRCRSSSAPRSAPARATAASTARPSESMFCHIPGLYVVYPATPADAKGMLKTAIRTTTRSCSSRARASTPRGASCRKRTTPSRSAWPRSPARAPTSRSSPGARPCPTPRRGRPARGRARRRGRGHRPAQPRAARHGDGPGVGAEDRPLRRRQPGGPRSAASSTRSSPGSSTRRSTTSTGRSAGSARRQRHQPAGGEPREGLPAERRRHRRRRHRPHLTDPSPSAEGPDRWSTRS